MENTANFFQGESSCRGSLINFHGSSSLRRSCCVVLSRGRSKSFSSVTDPRKKTIPYSYILNISKALWVNSTAKEIKLVIKNGFAHETQIKQPAFFRGFHCQHLFLWYNLQLCIYWFSGNIFEKSFSQFFVLLGKGKVEVEGFSAENRFKN